MEKVKRYESKFPEKLEEMAKVGIIGDMIIEVYTDHNPPHFHVTKKDKFEVRLDIESLKIISYKWQNKNEKISIQDIRKIKEWLNQKYKNKNITNKEAIEMFWDGMNN